MTRTGRGRPVGSDFGAMRLTVARAYLAAARRDLLLAERGEIDNPAMSQAINAATAFADALSARFGNRINQGDHGASAKMLRDALGNRLPASQESALRRILMEKDDVQYGPRALGMEDARAMVERLEGFAAWAELELARRA